MKKKNWNLKQNIFFKVKPRLNLAIRPQTKQKQQQQLCPKFLKNK